MVNDERHFEFLYERCFTPLYKYVYFRTRSRDLAMDLVQDVFVKAFEQGKPLDRDTALRYLYTIARNRLIDYYRKKKPIEVESFEDLVAVSADESVEGPERAYTRQESAGTVQELLETLSDTDREIVSMKYLQGLDTGEIADLTGKSDQNVRQILSRSMRRLKERYEQ